MIHKHSLIINFYKVFNPLNAKLNPIRHLLALVGAHHIVHVSRVRVKTEKSELCNTATGTMRDAAMLLLLCRPLGCSSLLHIQADSGVMIVEKKYLEQQSVWERKELVLNAGSQNKKRELSCASLVSKNS